MPRTEPIEIAARGCLPVWTPDGAFIYYQDMGSVSRVPVTNDPVFRILGPPEVVYIAQVYRAVGTFGALYFDVAADGTLYIAHAPASAAETQPIWVVNNWFEELNRIAPRSE